MTEPALTTIDRLTPASLGHPVPARFNANRLALPDPTHARICHRPFRPIRLTAAIGPRRGMLRTVRAAGLVAQYPGRRSSSWRELWP